MKIRKKIKLKTNVSDSTWTDPIAVFDTPEWVIEAIAQHGTGTSGGKQRVFDAVNSGVKGNELAKVLKKEYHHYGFGFKPNEKDLAKGKVMCGFSSMCKSYIENVKYYENGSYFITKVTYTELATVIEKLISLGKYYENPCKNRLVKKKATPHRKLMLKKKKVSNKKSNFKIFEGESYTGEWHNVIEGAESENEKVYFPLNPEKKRTDIIETIEDLKVLCDYMMDIPVFAFDTETNTLDVMADNPNFRCADITISWGENNNYDIILGHIRDEDIHRNIDLDEAVKLLKPVFERDDVSIGGANLKYDLHVLRRLGIIVKTKDLFDTQLASWICDENTPNGLKENSYMYMGVSQTKFNEATDSIPSSVKKQFGYNANAKVKDFGLVLIDDGSDYCTDDSFYTWCLILGFKELIIHEKMDKIYYNRMIPFMSVLLEMEEKGVSVDIDKLKKMQKDMEQDLEQLTYDIYELSGVEFNIGSAQQKAELLFGYEKPDTPIIKGKESKSTKTLVDKFHSGELSKEVFLEKIEKQGVYADSKGNLWKRSNRNDNILAHTFGFSVISETKGGAPSTDKNTLMQLSKVEFKNKRKRQGIEVVKKLLEYSKLDKLKGTFADGILEKLELYSDNKVHTNYNQIGTDSGRISSSKPNLQQLPNADEEDKYQIRDVFIGSEYYKALSSKKVYDTYEDMKKNEDPLLLKTYGYKIKRKKLIAVDYHNLEMVCLCYFSKDKNLTEMFSNDDDAHGSTAVNMFSLDCTPVECKKEYPHLRQAAKTINFMLMYGGGANTLYENLKYNPYDPLDLGAKEYLEQYDCKNGVEVAQKFIDRYFESYSGVAKFIKDQHRYAHKYGYVWTVIGRKRRLPDINSRNREYSAKAERLSVNASIQGTAGDITSSAQVRITKEPTLSEKLCHMLMQVHDEIVFECPEEYLEECTEIIKYYMEHPFGDSPKSQIAFLRADPGSGDTYQEAK